MIEAVMLWNEPNNLAHWNFGLDPEWNTFAGMIRAATEAIRAEDASLPIVLGGISPVDPWFIQHLEHKGALANIDIVAVHGFPYDWNHWTVHEWPRRLEQIGSVTTRPVWVTETGVSTFGHDHIQLMGMKQTARHLIGRVERIHWYTLFDLPKTWHAVAHQPQEQGAEYMRHFEMGLIREDGSPKPALDLFSEYVPEFGICQWFHFEDHRLDDGVRWMKRLGVRTMRTGLDWAESVHQRSRQWFDRLMRALEPFDTCVTFCFTPKHEGIEPHHASPPRRIEAFAEFCACMVRRYRT